MGDIDGLADFGMSDHWEHYYLQPQLLEWKGRRRARPTRLNDRERQEYPECEEEEGIMLDSVSAMVQYLQVCGSVLPRIDIMTDVIRKFFTFIISLNIIGLVLAILGKWQYARKYTGALVLGNLVAAILARNELFGRLLYLLTNMLFAKVCIMGSSGTTLTFFIL
jgi:hypothetical protein